MRLQIGIPDLAAVVTVAVALILPSPSRKVSPLYAGPAAAQASELARAQADWSRDPRDDAALARYTDLLSMSRQSDWALRIAGDAFASDSPTRWQAALAAASVHADRLEPQGAYEWAQKALAACNAPGADCPDHEHVRIDLYVKALKAGLDSGIDPRVDPAGFKQAIDSATPMIRVGGRQNKPPM